MSTSEADAEEEAQPEVIPQAATVQLPPAAMLSLSQKFGRESPSSLVTFMTCPLRWWYDRYSEGEWEPSNQYAVGGHFGHRLAEVFYEEPPAMRTQKVAMDIFYEAWRELKDSDEPDRIFLGDNLVDGFQALESFDNFEGWWYGYIYNRGKDAMINIFDMENPEKVDVLSTEYWVSGRNGDIKVRGMIDRLDKEVGGLVVVDYKTGRPPECDTSFDELPYFPCGIYCLLQENRLYEGEKVKGAKLFYVGKNTKKVMLKFTDERRESIQSTLDAISFEMSMILQTGRISTCEEPDPDYACSYCSMTDVCPAYQNGSTEAFLAMPQMPGNSETDPEPS